MPFKGQGKGGKTVRINETGHRQPRRSSKSVRGGETALRGCESVEQMYHYSNYRRELTDSYSFRMTAAEMDLSTAIWLASRQWLSPMSQECPFNQLQVLFYYEHLCSHMKQHRDNNSKRTMLATLEGETCAWQKGTCTGVGDSGCQVPGSSVAIFTIGTKAMTLHLRYPHPDSPGENMKKYIIHPAFTMRLGPGTLFILDPLDDVHFTHEACFDPAFGDDGGVRIAYVFRHCQQLHHFRTHPDSKRQIYIDPNITARKTMERKRKKARHAANVRRSLFKRMF